MIIKLAYLLIVFGLTAYSLWHFNPVRSMWRVVTPIFIFSPLYFNVTLLATFPPISFFMVSMLVVVVFSLYAYGDFQYDWDWIDTFVVISIVWTGFGASIKDSFQYAILTLLQEATDEFIPYFLIRLVLDKHQVLRSAYYLVLAISVLALIAPLEYFLNISIPTLLQKVWPTYVIPETFVRGGFNRVFSTFGHPIHAGMMFSFALFMSFTIFQMKVFVQQWKILLLMAVNSMAIYMTVSRTSYYLSVPILALIHFAFTKKRMLYGSFLGVALAGVLFVAMPALDAYSKSVGEGSSEEQTSAAYRAGLFDAYVPEILSEPIIGHGFWIPIVGMYYSIDNHYLFVLLRWGIPGLVFFCLPFVIAMIQALFYFARSKSTREQVVLWALLSYLVYYAIVASTVYLGAQVLIFLYMILGFIQVILKNGTKPQVLVSHAYPRWM